jgi:pilus assembly protein CpaE
MEGKKILIVDADAASRNFIARYMTDQKYEVIQAGSGKEGLIFAWRDRPDVLIVDPTLADLKGEEIATRLRQDARTANTPLIAISSDPSVARIKSCMDAGFNEYIVKSGQAMPSLNEALNRLMGINAAAVRHGGLLIVFMSAKGGTGTSSLCANIAMTIAQSQPEAPVVVVDLVLPIGSIAPIVGYDGPHNLVTVADMSPGETTHEFFKDHLTILSNWKFHLLAGSPDPESSNNLKVGRIWEIVSELKASYDYVIVDLGRSLSKISLPLIQNADLIVLVVGSDLSTVMLTKTLWDYLQLKGVQPASVYAVMNRAVGLEGLSKAEAEKILGFEIKTTMPYLGANFGVANNQHLPFSVKFSKETAPLVFRDMAQEIAHLARRLRSEITS